MALIPRAPLITRPQSRSVQQPQGFPNNAGLYTTAAVLAVGTALMAQAPVALRSQAPQPFQNPGRLYVPVPFGTQVLARHSSIAVQQPQAFGNLLGLYSAPATLPPLGQQQLESRRTALVNQAPQPFPNTAGLYTTLAYIAPASQIGAQVHQQPRYGQTPVAGAYVISTATYSPPSMQIAAQVPRPAVGQPTSVGSAPITLYSATYTPPSSNRFDVQPRQSAQPQSFVQGAQIGLYQPQIYRPPQALRFESPRLLPYSFAYQGLAQGAPLALYTTLPTTGLLPDLTRLLRISVDGRALRVAELNSVLVAQQTVREIGS
jgi:hypothetical protein